MQLGRLWERIVLKLPSWLAWTIAMLTLLSAGWGWALAGVSLMEFFRQWVTVLFGVGAIGKILDVFVIVLIFVVGETFAIIYGGVYLLPGNYLEDEDVLRVAKFIVIFWITFLIQVVFLPQCKLTTPHVAVCTPVAQEIEGVSLLVFFYGLIEGHGALLTATLEFLAGRSKAGRQVRTQAAWGNKAALWFLRATYLSLVVQALVLLIVPAAVEWWPPVYVCDLPKPNADDEGCIYGVGLGLCEYPWILVLGLYLNIALSLGLRTWPLIRDWWRMRDSKERIGGE